MAMPKAQHFDNAVGFFYQVEDAIGAFEDRLGALESAGKPCGEDSGQLERCGDHLVAGSLRRGGHLRIARLARADRDWSE